MTNTESAVYNRTSGKCHAFVKYYYPAEYKKLAAAAEEEYKTRKSRRNTLADIQNLLKPVEQNFGSGAAESSSYSPLDDPDSII